MDLHRRDETKNDLLTLELRTEVFREMFFNVKLKQEPQQNWQHKKIENPKNPKFEAEASTKSKLII